MSNQIVKQLGLILNRLEGVESNGGDLQERRVSLPMGCTSDIIIRNLCNLSSDFLLFILYSLLLCDVCM